MKVSSIVTLGIIGFFGIGGLIAAGYLTDDMIRKYGQNKTIDQALAVITTIVLIVIVGAAFFAYFAGRKDGQGSS
jgi:ABC-type branched-subunit amino acid transport system permease subunit